jgi:nucleoside-diphosphate-sugar epimerase
MPPLTVAVTGPTGEIGRPLMALLERTAEVGRVVGMARRPFDPSAEGWSKVEYRRGDVTNAGDVAALVDGADAVVHLAFIIMASGDSRAINLEGSRTVFRAAVDAGVPRLVYASSVAAYGFHADQPERLTEDIPPRGTEAHPYSAQKAEVEGLLTEVISGGATEAWIFRPCIVAGPEAPLLVDGIPFVRWGAMLPGAVRALAGRVPGLAPVLPDPGVPFQLVHHDDVAAALVAAILGRGEPGVYNLAADGEITVTELAHALGYHAVPVPAIAVDATAQVVARLPLLPPEASWIEAFRTPVLMDTAKARRDLGWAPEHDAHETLRAVVAGVRRRAQG